MMADTFWVKKHTQDKRMLSEDTKNYERKIQLSLFFHSPLQQFHSPWGEQFTRLRSTDAM